MKYYLIFAILLLAGTMLAQSADTIPWRYAELVGTKVAFSSKIIVQIDLGQRVKAFPGNDRVVVGTDGKPIKFNSMIDAMNHMSAHGWEFVQAYSMGDEHHWILRTRTGSTPVLKGGQ